MIYPVITVVPSAKMTDVASLLKERGGILQHRKGVSIIAPTLLPGYSKSTGVGIKQAA